MKVNEFKDKNLLNKIIMGNLLKDLKKYLKDTPDDVIEKDMDGLDEYNKTGPDMLDILPDTNVKTDGCSIDDILELKDDISRLVSFIINILENENINYPTSIKIPKCIIKDVTELAERKIEDLKSELSQYTITKE